MEATSAAMAAAMSEALDHAAHVLSGFLDSRLHWTAEVRISRHRLAELPALCGPEDTPVAAAFFEVTGDLTGYLLLAIPEEPARQIVDELLGTVGPAADEELVNSTIGELGNVVGSAFLNALADRFGRRVAPSPPQVAWDMVGALLSTLAGALATRARSEWPVVHTHLKANDVDYPTYLIWIPGDANGRQWEDAT
ncbi:MAG TPA: chemotaxis protein CheX [Limnochordales bacterium]